MSDCQKSATLDSLFLFSSHVVNRCLPVPNARAFPLRSSQFDAIKAKRNRCSKKQTKISLSIKQQRVSARQKHRNCGLRSVSIWGDKLLFMEWILLGHQRAGASPTGEITGIHPPARQTRGEGVYRISPALSRPGRAFSIPNASWARFHQVHIFLAYLCQVCCQSMIGVLFGFTM